MADQGREARRRERASWTIRKLALQEERSPDVSALSPRERLAMVWQLTLDAWALSGRPLPTYERGEAPGRIVRRDVERT